MFSNRWLAGLVVLLIMGCGPVGCASTGRGDFPHLSLDESGETSLVIAPPLGAVSNSLTQSVFHHLDEPALRNRFQSVRLIELENRGEAVVRMVRSGSVTPEARRILSDYTDARYVLLFYVNRFEVAEYTLTETRTLYRTSTTQRSSTLTGHGTTGSMDDKRGPGAPDPSDEARQDDTGSYRSTRENQVTAIDVPLPRGQVRVVLSLAAVLYDQQKQNAVWSGHRIERLDDAVRDRSVLELQDVVVQRVMKRIMSRLTSA